jgi:hypothetical protein
MGSITRKAILEFSLGTISDFTSSAKSFRKSIFLHSMKFFRCVKSLNHLGLSEISAEPFHNHGILNGPKTSYRSQTVVTSHAQISLNIPSAQ